jgi:hypothetical protein
MIFALCAAQGKGVLGIVMTDNAKLPWRQQYEDAVAEQDLAKLPVKLTAAEDAILIRQMELAKTSDAKQERRALTEACIYALYKSKN